MKTKQLKSRSEVNLHPIHFKSINFTDCKYKAEGGGKISGYLSRFGVVDSDGDLLVKGCFAKSITERGPNSSTARKIAFLWQHDMKDPIGQLTTLREDDYGLYFECKLDTGGAVQNADRAVQQLNSGTLDQFSVGFQYVWDKMEYDESLDAYVVKEVNLFEGSVVTLGANEFASFTGMKSQELVDKKAALIEETETFIKSLPFALQHEARMIITKNIALSQAMKADTTDSDADTEGAGDIDYIDQAVPLHAQGNTLIDACMPGMKSQDLKDLCGEMKDMHTDCMTKMLNIRSDIKGTKSLTKPTKPVVKKELPLSRLLDEPTESQDEGLNINKLLKIF